MDPPKISRKIIDNFHTRFGKSQNESDFIQKVSEAYGIVFIIVLINVSVLRKLSGLRDKYVRYLQKKISK